MQGRMHKKLSEEFTEIRRRYRDAEGVEEGTGSVPLPSRLGGRGEAS